MSKRHRVDRKDKFRCLVTEVLPAETPIIFSNDGFYLRCLRNAVSSSALEHPFNIIVKQTEELANKNFIPFSYRIRKNSLDYRVLSVPHPAAQWQVKNFYEHLAPAILHHTSESNFTIRSPASEASVYYKKGALSDSGKFKKSGVSELGVDKYLKHSSSYFSYRGYSRLYKFFDSDEFIDLEARFPHFWTMDISKCFDSIYTHSISWAVKDKAFAKDNIRVPSFSACFDALMQSMNYGETSGILIGPELSRIFAEIILQSVDSSIQGRLEEVGLITGCDYSVRRYVDDYFIFSKNTDIAATIYSTVAEELSKYKLNVNSGKVSRITRPFLTSKSKVILEVSERLNHFTRTIAKEGENKGGSGAYLVPKEIFSISRLVIKFCNDIKLCCAANECSYDEVAGYLMAGLKNRANAVMALPSKVISDQDSLHYKSFFEAILRIAFFLYSVAPSVTSSYKLCSLVILSIRFFEGNVKGHADSIRALIASLTEEVLLDSGSRRSVEGFTDLEIQNLLLAMFELGSSHTISSDVIESVFCREDKRCSYFNLITLLFYIKDNKKYAKAKYWSLGQIELMLSDLNDVLKSSEKALALLDFVACPYIDKARRAGWMEKFFDAMGVALPCPASEIVEDFENFPWFVNWKEIDLLNLLERRELQVVY